MNIILKNLTKSYFCQIQDCRGLDQLPSARDLYLSYTDLDHTPSVQDIEEKEKALDKQRERLSRFTGTINCEDKTIMYVDKKLNTPDDFTAKFIVIKMAGDFKYKKEGNFHTIQKRTYPRFTATFDYRTPLPELIHIKFADKCNAADMANALSELDVYMKSIRKEVRANKS